MYDCRLKMSHERETEALGMAAESMSLVAAKGTGAKACLCEWDMPGGSSKRSTKTKTILKDTARPVYPIKLKFTS